MFLSDFDYELPDRLIARHPQPERASSRLLVVDVEQGEFRDGLFSDLPALLRAGDRLVLNDTRVIKARLRGRKSTGGAVEVLVERLIGEHHALAHVRASKSPKAGGVLRFDDGTKGRVVRREGPLFVLEFTQPIAQLLEDCGEVPLPPYLGRSAQAEDDERYQTVYARRPGAVAAPTAGLHFDAAMLDTLAKAGVDQSFVTLHVGAGTFQALREAKVDDNRLHSERVELSDEVCRSIHETRVAGGRVVSVGTTSARVLEAASASGQLEPMSGETDLFIRPGYAFRTVDVLLTNFHLPRSSLLMLVSALAGRDLMLAAYQHAVNAEYRFFSYGDAMLIVGGSAKR